MSVSPCCHRLDRGSAVNVTPHLLGYPGSGPTASSSGRWKAAGRARRRVTSSRPGSSSSSETTSMSSEDSWERNRRLLPLRPDLETAVMLGAVLSWAHDEDPFVSVSNLARGTPDHEAWEMTKWFDTNYHYVVPELTDQPTKLTPLPWREPVNGTTWVVLGPFSLVKLRVAGDPARHRPERRPCPLGVGGEVHRCAAATRRAVVGAGARQHRSRHPRSRLR